MRLTVKQAAKQASVSASLVYAWVREQRLKCYRFGREGKRGRILIEQEDLEAVVEQCKSGDRPAEGGAT